MLECFVGNRFVNRIAHKAVFASAMCLCMLWSALATLGPVTASGARAVFCEWHGASTGKTCASAKRIVDAEGSGRQAAGAHRAPG
jgi:hypothetical protein